jgi:hypothetical protein
MTGPPRPGPGQPWWVRPGGAPLQGQPPSFTSPPRQPVAPPPPSQQAPPTRPPASPPTVQPKRSRRRTLVWAGLAIVAFEVVVLVVALWFFGYIGGMVLDVRQAEAGVQQILSDPINGYGANEVTSVTCNDGRDPMVEQGEGFTCQVTINGARRQVQVVFRDDAGTYEIDGPR